MIRFMLANVLCTRRQERFVAAADLSRDDRGTRHLVRHGCWGGGAGNGDINRSASADSCVF